MVHGVEILEKSFADLQVFLGLMAEALRPWINGKSIPAWHRDGLRIWREAETGRFRSDFFGLSFPIYMVRAHSFLFSYIICIVIDRLSLTSHLIMHDSVLQNAPVSCTACTVSLVELGFPMV